MSLLQITDNHDWKRYTDCIKDLCTDDSDLENLQKIANVDIGKLNLDDNPNLLIFPKDFDHYGDEISENFIISLQDNRISTGNIMGFVGVNETQIDIKSRFDKEDNNDYFMHYMLQKVFSINLFDIKHTTNRETIFDFLLYLFPHFLKTALRQGVFKKYQKFEYNDANIRGPININRHIKENIPFRGTVSYSTREHSYDNQITQLIRHTIEYIRTKEEGYLILNNDLETKGCISQIRLATQTYNSRERQNIINKNLRPIHHPYYTAYTALQKLCLQILRHESIKYGQEKDKVYGVLFDGAWLWEEYLNTILHQFGFKHPQNKKKKGGIPMFDRPEEYEQFSKNSKMLYPDFYKDNYILDAKYKHLNSGVGREDLYQVITYMFCTKAKNGVYVYPYKIDSEPQTYRLTNRGYDGDIHVIPYYIPQKCANWSDFYEKIEISTQKLTNYLFH